MKLYREAREANQEAMKERGLTPISSGSHSGISWEVFVYNFYDGDFNYLGSLTSPSMWGHELSSEFNPKFKAWFLERIKAYGILHGWSNESIVKLCYRPRYAFGTLPSKEQMTFPFKEGN